MEIRNNLSRLINPIIILATGGGATNVSGDFPGFGSMEMHIHLIA